MICDRCGRENIKTLVTDEGGNPVCERCASDDAEAREQQERRNYQ